MNQPPSHDQQPWDALPPEPGSAPAAPPPSTAAQHPPQPSAPGLPNGARSRGGGSSATPWWRAAWALLAAGVVLGLIIGVPSGFAAKGAQPAETETATRTRTATEVHAPETRLRTVTQVQTVSPTPSTPNAVIFPGTFLINSQIQPGTYQTQEPDCYWERLSGTSGDFDDIIANDITNGPGIVSIPAADVAFNSDCSWAKIG